MKKKSNYPPKIELPYSKIQPLLVWMDFIFTLILMLGVTFSMDKMTMHFKGHNADKIRMTYKTEGY